MAIEDSQSTTDEFVAFAGGTLDVPAAAMAAAGDVLRRVLQRAFDGARRPESRLALEAVRGWETPPQATAFGHGVRLGPQWAAFVNGVAARNATVPAALALAEYVKASGALLCEAIAVGCEVEARIERAAGAAHEARGWDVRGTHGRVGALFAAARVLGLTGSRLRHALGIAATQAAGMRIAAGTMTEAFVPGKAAADAVEAALLARAGLTGPALPLEGRRGFVALMAPGFDPATALQGLGTAWLGASRRYAVPEESPANAEGDDRLLRVLRDIVRSDDVSQVIAQSA